MRHTYDWAVAWIAMNDNPDSREACNAEELSGYLTVCLVADIFGKPQAEVARDVVRMRQATQTCDD